MKQYWRECLVDDTLCEIGSDGLLFRFRLADIVSLLKEYPSDSLGWYFNTSRDRYIAERDGDNFVTVNPSFVWKHFKDILY